MSKCVITERIHSMQVDMTLYLMKRWKIDQFKFIELDDAYDILGFIRLRYEPFHLMGDEGIAEEVEAYIREKGGISKNTKRR